MSMDIASVETQIEAVVATVTDIKASYDYPIADIGRKLPALVIMYDGFEDNERLTFTKGKVVWNFEFTVYLPADGKNLKAGWDALKALVPKVLDAFRANATLNSACLDSEIANGEAVIHVPEQGVSQYVGHSFNLRAEQTE